MRSGPRAGPRADRAIAQKVPQSNTFLPVPSTPAFHGVGKIRTLPDRSRTTQCNKNAWPTCSACRRRLAERRLVQGVEMQKLMFACAHYAALAVFVCGCWGWGRAVMARLSPPVGRDAWLEAVMAVALGLGLFICAFQALAMVGVFRLGATVGLVGLGVAAAVLQFAPWRREVKALRAHAVRVAWTQSDKLAMAALALVALPALVEPLAPPVAFDEVMYHLPYARQVALEGSLGIYDWLRYPWFPYNYNLLYAAALQVGDDVFPHLLSALAGGLSALMVYRLCIQHADRLTACIGTAIWLGLGDYRSAMIDMGVALLLLTACVAILWWRQARPAGTGGHWLGLAAFFLGLAAGSKYQALVYLPLVAVFVAWHERRISAWASALVLFLLPSGYWYARNAILTGDPFNPIGGPVFGFTDWNPADHAVQIADVRVRAEMPNRLLWAVFLAPFSAAWKRSGVVRAAGWFCLYAVVVWTVTSRYPRYLMAVFPLLAIMAALGWQVLFGWLAAGVRRMAERGDRGWRAPASGHEPRRVGVGVGVWLAMALLAGLAAVAVQHTGRNAAAISLTPEARNAFLRERVQGYAVMDYMRRNATGRVYHVSLSQAIYYGPNPVWGDDALGPWNTGKFASREASEMASRLRRHGFDFVVISAEFLPLLTADPGFDAHFAPFHEEDGSAAYRILPRAASPKPPDPSARAISPGAIAAAGTAWRSARSVRA
jgi:hypothetical protein